MNRKIIYDNGLFNVSFSEEAKNYHIHMKREPYDFSRGRFREE